MIYQCIGIRSDRPYIIRDTQTGIYSLEELLYYVRENVFMLNPEDFGPALSRFLRKRLELPDLAEKYDEMLDRGKDFADRISMLFKESRFANDTEIETLRKALSHGEHMSVSDSHRVRGEFFLKSGRTAEAVIEFNAALKVINREEDPKDAAKLLCGMGNAAAGNFNFDRALRYFEEASELTSEDPVILNKLIAAARLSKNDDAFYVYMVSRNIPENIYSECLRRITEAGKHSMRNEDARRFKEAVKARQDGDFPKYISLRHSVLQGWKSEYRN